MYKIKDFRRMFQAGAVGLMVLVSAARYCTEAQVILFGLYASLGIPCLASYEFCENTGRYLIS